MKRPHLIPSKASRDERQSLANKPKPVTGGERAALLRQIQHHEEIVTRLRERMNECEPVNLLPEKWLKKPVIELVAIGVEIQLVNALEKAGILLVEDLLRRTRNDLLVLPQVSAWRLRSLMLALKKIGFEVQA